MDKKTFCLQTFQHMHVLHLCSIQWTSRLLKT